MKFCPECGAKLANENTKFCPECGAKLNATTTPKAEEPPISSKPIDPLMEEYEYEVLPDGSYAIIKPKDKYKTKYVIPDEVSIIREKAFSPDNAAVYEEVVLPNTLRIIELRAFEFSRLLEIKFPQGLEVIGSWAFRGSKLSQIHLLEGFRVLSTGVFKECQGIKEVILSDKVKELPESLFENSRIDKLVVCGNLKRKIIDGNCSPFSNAKIGKLDVKESVIYIGKQIFEGAEIDEISFPPSVKDIRENAFREAKVGKITFSEGMESIRIGAFEKAQLPETIYLPKTLTRVADTAFSYTYGLKEIIYNGEAKINVELGVKVLNKSEIEEKRDKGISFFAGKTNDKSLKKVASGNVVFYLDKYNYCGDDTAWKIVGIESSAAIECLEIPSGNIRFIESSCIENVKRLILPRDMKKILFFSPTRGDLQIASFVRSGVVQIVIPKEAETFSVRDSHALGTIREIKFEDPAGWGLSMDIIGHPKNMYDYIFRKGVCELKKRTGIGGMFKKLFGGR